MEPSYFLQPNNQLEDFAQHWSSNQQQQLEPAQQTRGNELEDASADQWADFGGADSYFGGQGRTRSSLGTENPYELPPGQIDPSPMVPRMVFSGPAPTLASPSPIPAESAPQQTPQPVKTGAWDAEETSRLLHHASFTETNCWNDIYPQLQTNRTLESVKGQHARYKICYYHPEVTRSFDSSPAPRIIGPAPSPDWKPWHPTEHETLVAMLKPTGNQNWSAIQKALGTDRSVMELQRHVGMRKGSRSDAAKTLATTATSVGCIESTPNRPASLPAPLNANVAEGGGAAPSPNSVYQGSATAAAPPPHHSTTLPYFPTPQAIAAPISVPAALYNLLSAIADILAPTESSASEQAHLPQLLLCGRCSNPIVVLGEKRGSEQEEGEGESTKRRKVGDLGKEGAAGEDGQDFGGWA